MLHRLSTPTLVKMALGGSVVCLGMGIGWMEIVQARVRDTPPFQDAMRLFLRYEAGLEMLGQPVKVRRLDLTSGGPNKVTDIRSELVIPLEGKKSAGRMYAFSSRQNPTQIWTVDRLDLEVDTPQKMRWTFIKGAGFDLTPYTFATSKQTDSNAPEQSLENR